jgi:hypothetical protein
LDGSGRVGTGLKRVGSSTYFFQIFLPAPVLDPPVLTGHGSDGFEHGSDRGGSRGRVFPGRGFLTHNIHGLTQL